MSIKLGGTGLNEKKLKWIIGTHGHWKNQNPGGRFGVTVKLDFKELLIKEQIDFKELFTDYQLFYTINLLLNKELLLI